MKVFFRVVGWDISITCFGGRFAQHGLPGRKEKLFEMCKTVGYVGVELVCQVCVLPTGRGRGEERIYFILLYFTSLSDLSLGGCCQVLLFGR